MEAMGLPFLYFENTNGGHAASAQPAGARRAGGAGVHLLDPQADGLMDAAEVLERYDREIRADPPAEIGVQRVWADGVLRTSGACVGAESSPCKSR